MQRPLRAGTPRARLGNMQCGSQGRAARHSPCRRGGPARRHARRRSPPPHLRMSQTRPTASMPPEAASDPSHWKATVYTERLCPSCSCRQAPVSQSQRRQVRSKLAVPARGGGPARRPVLQPWRACGQQGGGPWQAAAPGSCSLAGAPKCRPMGWNAMRPSRSVCPVSVRSSLPSADQSLATASVAPLASASASLMRPARGRGQAHRAHSFSAAAQPGTAGWRLASLPRPGGGPHARATHPRWTPLGARQCR